MEWMSVSSRSSTRVLRVRKGVVALGEGARAGDEHERDDEDGEVRYELPNLFGRSLAEGNGSVGTVECSKGDRGCTPRARSWGDGSKSCC